MRWEYIRYAKQIDEDVEIEDQLTNLGHEGWECFAVVPYESYHLFYLKRVLKKKRKS